MIEEKRKDHPGIPLFGKIRFSYANYRGEVRIRVVEMVSIRLGSSPYHPDEQWLLLAHDLEKMQQREFAMKDMKLVEILPRDFKYVKPDDSR